MAIKKETIKANLQDPEDRLEVLRILAEEQIGDIYLEIDLIVEDVPEEPKKRGNISNLKNTKKEVVIKEEEKIDDPFA